MEVPWQYERIKNLRAKISKEWLKTKTLMLHSLEILENLEICTRRDKYEPDEKIQWTIQHLSQIKLDKINDWEAELIKLEEEYPEAEEEEELVEKGNEGSIDNIFGELQNLLKVKNDIQRYFPLKLEKLYTKSDSELSQEFLRWLQARLVYTWDILLRDIPRLDWTETQIYDFIDTSHSSGFGLMFAKGPIKDTTRKELSGPGRKLILPILAQKVHKAALYNNWKRLSTEDFYIAYLLTLRQKVRQVDHQYIPLFEEGQQLAMNLEKDLVTYERGTIWVDEKTRKSVKKVKDFYLAKTGKESFNQVTTADKIAAEAKFLKDSLPILKSMENDESLYKEILNRVTFSEIDRKIVDRGELEYPVQWEQFKQGEARMVMRLDEERVARNYEYGFEINSYKCRQLKWSLPGNEGSFFHFENQKVVFSSQDSRVEDDETSARNMAEKPRNDKANVAEKTQKIII